MACNNIFTRKTIFAALFAIGAAGSAQAEAISWVAAAPRSRAAATTRRSPTAWAVPAAAAAQSGPIRTLVTFAGSDGDGGSRWNYGRPPTATLAA